MNSAAVQRHKLVRKSKLPFNSLMKEIRKSVPRYDVKTSSRLIISKKMRKKLDRRFISTEEIRIAIAKGHARKESRTTTRTPAGNRLLTEHEKGRKTILKAYYSTSSRVLRQRSVPSICVRYTATDKGYVIIDAYKPKGSFSLTA